MFEKYISKGFSQPVHKLYGSKRADFVRRMIMLCNDIVPESKCHVAVHEIKHVPKSFGTYAEMHAHKCDEICLVLGKPGKLKYKFVLGNEAHILESPSSIFIPKRLPHMMEAVSGSGTLVVILLSGSIGESMTN